MIFFIHHHSKLLAVSQAKRAGKRALSKMFGDQVALHKKLPLLRRGLDHVHPRQAVGKFRAQWSMRDHLQNFLPL